MTIRHMRIFIAVFQEMNITKAAEVLHMTQPAVSRAIQELESYYGIHLFERIHHRLFRTESSYAFYARAPHLIDEELGRARRPANWRHDHDGEFRASRPGIGISEDSS